MKIKISDEDYEAIRKALKFYIWEKKDEDYACYRALYQIEKAKSYSSSNLQRKSKEKISMTQNKSVIGDAKKLKGIRDLK